MTKETLDQQRARLQAEGRALLDQLRRLNDQAPVGSVGWLESTNRAYDPRPN